MYIIIILGTYSVCMYDRLFLKVQAIDIICSIPNRLIGRVFILLKKTGEMACMNGDSRLPPAIRWLTPSKMLVDGTCSSMMDSVDYYSIVQHTLADGHHKLIRWRLVTHRAIDGYSRLFIYTAQTTTDLLPCTIYFLKQCRVWSSISSKHKTCYITVVLAEGVSLLGALSITSG